MYRLEGASIAYDSAPPVLQGLDWTSEPSGVEVLFGGSGEGKSSLLRALSGIRPPTMRLGGRWLFNGESEAFSRGRPFPGVAWFGQPVRGFRPSEPTWGGLERALDTDGSTLLLDEPNCWVTESGYDRLAERVRERAKTATVLLTTHHVEFGRRVADRVLLIGGHRVVTHGKAATFFGTNAPDSARAFVRDGNFVPRRTLEPPRGLKWVREGALGGMSRPGTMRSLEDDIQALADLGVTHLVTLTRSVLGNIKPADYGIEAHHCPIQDMGVPSLRVAHRICRQIQGWLAQGGCVVVHCRGGMGRTGLVLALSLVQEGMSAEDAIAEVRAVNRHYIQTSGQLAFVREFELDRD